MLCELYKIRFNHKMFSYLLTSWMDKSNFYLISGPPDPPTNCSVLNQTTDSLEVQCLPGFNGGLQQSFLLEVTDIQTKVLLANATDKIPEFTVCIYLI